MGGESNASRQGGSGTLRPTVTAMVLMVLMVLMVNASLVGFSQAMQDPPIRNMGLTGQKTVRIMERCPANPDPLYDRRKILGQLADVLNASSPRFKKYENRGFQVEDERPKHFFVFDLTDPSNKTTLSGGCINFQESHIYHFAARYIPFSLSHVAILNAGKLTVFKSINCDNSKDSVDSVIEYIESRLTLNDKDEIIQRVRDYRKYGEYFTVDDLVIRCKQKN